MGERLHHARTLSLPRSNALNLLHHFLHMCMLDKCHRTLQVPAFSVSYAVGTILP